MRRLARELDIDLTTMRGTGEKGRITKDDVKAVLARPELRRCGGAGLGGRDGHPGDPGSRLLQVRPDRDASRCRASRRSPARTCIAPGSTCPHVTHQDEADITEIDVYRKELDAARQGQGLPRHAARLPDEGRRLGAQGVPGVQCSLSPEKDALILKKYYHIGIAVDTPEGLVVPVIRDVDRKGIGEISQELGTVSKKARDGKLGVGRHAGCLLHDLQPGRHRRHGLHADRQCARGRDPGRRALPDGAGLERRGLPAALMLPLSVSYDHRVIDGALAARFTRHLAHVLEDVRRLVL